MSTNRELLFRYKKQGIPDTVIHFALEECNGFDYVLLTQRLDKDIKDENRFVEAMSRYQQGEMIEYIFNKAFFLSKPFYVNKHVLIPRQETEQLVLSTINRIKNMFGDKKIAVADVCAGSGVIGVSLANVFKENTFYLTDISSEALDVALINSSKLSNVRCLCGDMLEPLIKENIQLDVLVCNPPYIANIETIDKKTWEQEPHLALLADPATKFYESILSNYQKVMNDKFLLAFEIGEEMEEDLTQLIKKYCSDASFSFEKDIYNKTRFLFIEKQK